MRIILIFYLDDILGILSFTFDRFHPIIMENKRNVMPIQMITPQLGFADQSGCLAHPAGFAIVHACKSPCHQQAVGYTKSLPKTDPHYLSYQSGNDLYLNLIDPPQPLFQMESFQTFFRFVDFQIARRSVLIHCNQGESRAPSLALLYAAKRLNLFPDESYAAARATFEKQFPYKPGQGIVTYLTVHWKELN